MGALRIVVSFFGLHGPILRSVYALLRCVLGNPISWVLVLRSVSVGLAVISPFFFLKLGFAHHNLLGAKERMHLLS